MRCPHGTDSGFGHRGYNGDKLSLTRVVLDAAPSCRMRALASEGQLGRLFRRRGYFPPKWVGTGLVPTVFSVAATDGLRGWGLVT